MENWELIAREMIRDTLARYHWSGDSARIDDLAQCFCADGELEVRGQPAARGRPAIAAYLGGVAGSARTTSSVKRIVRHTLTNIRFVELSPRRARVESYFTVFTEIGLDHFGRYRDVLVPVAGAARFEWLIASRFVSTDWRAADSVMAGPGQ